MGREQKGEVRSQIGQLTNRSFISIKVGSRTIEKNRAGIKRQRI